ncbi:MAG: deoxynucleoside kinase [Phycisphaerae bacterium]|nr:deoxynucleoside kinase [Phycisphaerae bacterium]
MSAKLISIIGPPGCGKTTLATNLARVLGGRFIREPFASNPFLADAYGGQADARLPAQLYFLLSRAGQLARTVWPAEGLCVSDYGFCQDRLFAETTLAAEELALYEPIRERLAVCIHPPELLILLDAPEAELLRRIAARGREFEKVMTADFLGDMRARYRRVADAAACSVLRVDNHAVDLRNPAELATLAADVRRTLELE